MKLHTSLPLLLLLTTCIVSQARVFYGRVLSESDSTSVSGAACVLTAPDRSVLCRDTTRRDGRFAIRTEATGILDLVISSPGYADIRAMIESPLEEINLGTLWMSEATVLDEFVVEGRIETDAAGRTIVYPSLSQVKASANSLDLFMKLNLPGLVADPVNRSMNVLGDAPVIIIDGVPSTMSDFLSIAPSRIAKIEYSILPPAKYAPTGQNGYISVTLKERTDGGSVYLWGRSALQTAFMDGSFAASYHQGPSEFKLSYSPSWRNYHDVHDEMTGAYIGDDFRVDLSSTDRNPFHYFTSPVSLRYIFSPKVSTLFSATFNVYSSASHRRQYGDMHDSVAGDYEFHNETDDKDLSTSLDLYFKRDFNEKNTLEVDMVGTISDNRYWRDNNYLYPTRPDENYRIDVDGARKSLITSATYQHSFARQTALSAGLTNTLSHNRNKYVTTDYVPVLTENNNYAYVSFTHLIGRFYFNVSTGLSLYWMKNDDVRRHYFRNNSRATLQWTPSQVFSLTGSFNYNSGIPGLSSLTDYMQQISPYLFSNGNPDLKTSYSLFYSLRPTVRYRWFTALLTAYYSSRPNAVFNDITYIGDGKFLSQSINARKSSNGGVAVQLGVNDLHGFGCGATVNYAHYTSAGPDWSHVLDSWSGSVQAWYTLRHFTLEAWYRIPGKYLNGHNVGQEENGSMLSLMYRPDKRWSFTASWMYIFDRGTKYPSWNYSEVNPSASRRWIGNNANMVTLTVCYQTDFGSIFRTGRRTLENSDSGSSILKF
ncbi:MAG: hypothetical protein HDR80_07600 [Bacteroides sp.]|nr:hypothetical protein [Bacteroides sp.]